MSTREELIGTIATVFFAGMSKAVMWLDWSYADSIFIGPLQHLVSIVAGLIAIIVGLPVAVKQVQKFIHFIKNIF